MQNFQCAVEFPITLVFKVLSISSIISYSFCGTDLRDKQISRVCYEKNTDAVMRFGISTIVKLIKEWNWKSTVYNLFRVHIPEINYSIISQ